MKEAAGNMAFEKAEIIRKKIEHLENYQARSVIVNKHIVQADVFSMFRDEGVAFINYLMVENGTIVQTHTTEAKPQLEETDAEILAFAIAQLRDRFNSTAPEIIVAIPMEYPEDGVFITIPKGGDKKKLLELSEKNVNYYREETERKRMLHLSKKTPEERLEVLQLCSPICNCLNCRPILNALTILISRVAIPFLPWYVSGMAWKVKKITAISM